ncbi:MAG: cell division protein FtsQ/DivIB [Kiloniellales bacterium]
MRRLTRWRGKADGRRGTAWRRRETGAWRTPARRLVAAGLIGVLGLGAASWAWRSGAIGAAIDRTGRMVIAGTGSLGLRLRQVLVEGRFEIPRATILAALDVRLGMPMLGFDPRTAKRRLERLGWVRSAVVERRFPGTIYVRLDESRPLAVWQNQGRFTLVGRDGQSIPGVDPRRFTGLLQVVGPGAGAEAPRLIEMLASEPALKARVVAAVLVSGRRWNLRFDNGVDVRFPAMGAGQAWARLARLQAEHNILERDLVAIDLRQPNRLIGQLSPRAAERSGLAPAGKPRRRRAPDET